MVERTRGRNGISSDFIYSGWHLLFSMLFQGRTTSGLLGAGSRWKACGLYNKRMNGHDMLERKSVCHRGAPKIQPRRGAL